MSSVIDELGKVGSEKVVLFFYCKAGDDSTQCAGAVLRNIIAQLYEKMRLLWPENIEPSTKLLSNAWEQTLGKKEKTLGKKENTLGKKENTLGKKENTLGKKESTQGKDGGSLGRDEMEFEYAKSVKNLKQLLEDFSRLLGRRIFIVIDALDECSDRQSERLVSSLRDLVKENTKIKILVASRPEVDLAEGLEGIPKIEVREDNNSKDIKAYLTEELNKLSGCRPKERKIAHREIMKRSAGMFKYANLAIDQLRQPWRRPIKEYLATYPDGLEAFYRQIFQGIKPELRRVLVVTFRWATLAKGDVTPLLVAEDYTRFFAGGDDDGSESGEDRGSEEGVDTDDENEDSEHSRSRDWADVSGGENESEGSEYSESENRVEAMEGGGVVAADVGNMTSNDGTPEDHTADSKTSDDDRGVLDNALRHVKEAGGSVFVNSIARDVPLRLQHSAVKDFVQRESERSTLTHCKTFCPRCARIEGETSLLSVTPKHGHLAISLTICEFTAPTSPGSTILPDWIFKVLTNPGSPPAHFVSSYSSELQDLQETISPCRRDRKR